jgi:hypothetical protein
MSRKHTSRAISGNQFTATISAGLYQISYRIIKSSMPSSVIQSQVDGANIVILSKINRGRALFGFDLFDVGLRIVVGGRFSFALASARAPTTARNRGSALLPRPSQSSLGPFQVFLGLSNGRQRFLCLLEFLLCFSDCIQIGRLFFVDQLVSFPGRVSCAVKED